MASIRNLIISDVQEECPINYGTVVAGGKRCCKYDECRGQPMGIESTCCALHNSIPCNAPPCKSNEGSVIEINRGQWISHVKMEWTWDIEFYLKVVDSSKLGEYDDDNNIYTILQARGRQDEI